MNTGVVGGHSRLRVTTDSRPLAQSSPASRLALLRAGSRTETVLELRSLMVVRLNSTLWRICVYSWSSLPSALPPRPRWHSLTRREVGVASAVPSQTFVACHLWRSYATGNLSTPKGLKPLPPYLPSRFRHTVTSPTSLIAPGAQGVLNRAIIGLPGICDARRYPLRTLFSVHEKNIGCAWMTHWDPRWCRPLLKEGSSRLSHD